MKTVVRLLEHAFDLNVLQIKQFRDSLELHRVSLFVMVLWANKTLTKLVKSDALFFRGSVTLVDFQLFHE